MRRLFTEVTRSAHFLKGERGALQLQRVLGAGELTAGLGEEPRQSRRDLREGAGPRTFEDGVLADVLATGGTLRGLSLPAGTLTRWSAERSTWEDLAAPSGTLDILHLDGATVRRASLAGARLAAVSLRDAVLEDVDLSGASLVLCDLTGATLRRVDLRGARLNGCDLAGAVLEDVQVEGADLRGATLRDAWLRGVDLTGTQVDGADLRGAMGTDPTALRARGARTGGGWLARAWAKVLGDSPDSWLRVRSAVTWTWAAIAFVLPVLFFLRAALDPVNPDEPPFWEGVYEPDEPQE